MIDQILAPLFIFWIIGLILAFVRKDLDISYKFGFGIIFIFYFLFFYPELVSSGVRIRKDYSSEIVSWINGAGKSIFFLLIYAWPIILFRIFYSGKSAISNFTLKTLIASTIIYWIIFLITMKFPSETDIALKYFQRFIRL